MKKNILYIVIGLLLGITSMYIVNASDLNVNQNIANAKAYLEKMFFTQDGNPGNDKVVQIYGTGSGKIEVGSASEVQINGDGSGTIDVGDHVKIDGDGSGKMDFEHVEIDGSGTIDVNGDGNINADNEVKVGTNVTINESGTIDVQGVGNINADNNITAGSQVNVGGDAVRLDSSGNIRAFNNIIANNGNIIANNGDVKASNEVKVGGGAVTLDKDGNINAGNEIKVGSNITLKSSGKISGIGLEGHIITDDINIDSDSIAGSALAVAKVQENTMALSGNMDIIHNDLDSIVTRTNSLEIDCPTTKNGSGFVTDVGLCTVNNTVTGVPAPISTLPYITTGTTAPTGGSFTCGSDSRNYDWDDNGTSFGGDLCDAGNPTNTSPSFPLVMNGTTSTRECKNTIGQSTTCTASKTSAGFNPTKENDCTIGIDNGYLNNTQKGACKISCDMASNPNNDPIVCSITPSVCKGPRGKACSDFN